MLNLHKFSHKTQSVQLTWEWSGTFRHTYTPQRYPESVSVDFGGNYKCHGGKWGQIQDDAAGSAVTGLQRKPIDIYSLFFFFLPFNLATGPKRGQKGRKIEM